MGETWFAAKHRVEASAAAYVYEYKAFSAVRSAYPTKGKTSVKFLIISAHYHGLPWPSVVGPHLRLS